MPDYIILCIGFLIGTTMNAIIRNSFDAYANIRHRHRRPRKMNIQEILDDVLGRDPRNAGRE